MRRFAFWFNTSIAFLYIAFMHCTSLNAAEVRLIYPELEPQIDGKEVDWIHGDYVMQNHRITAIIAAPTPHRDANLTVRNVGASIIDLSLRNPSNDQLSGYFPAGARYLFQDPSQVQVGRTENGVYWTCTSSASVANDGTSATVTYLLTEDSEFIDVAVVIRGEKFATVAPFDGIRADRSFEFKQVGNAAASSDAFFRQTIGFTVPDSTRAPSWEKDRMYRIRYAPDQVVTSDDSIGWHTRIHPATSLLDLQSALTGTTTNELRTFQVISPTRPSSPTESVLRATLNITSKSNPELSGKIQTDDQGLAAVRLPAGEYTVNVDAVGYPTLESLLNFSADEQTAVTLQLEQPSGFTANVVDQNGNSIPAKVTIYATNGQHPKYGPDSTRTFVMNCVYAVHGKMLCPLPDGDYEVYFSHGPEYDSVVKQVTVQAGKLQSLDITLPHVVDTTGWISAELHSHSSPSGDNTSDQYGRVENLLCEHLEFAPCTEHARVSSYLPHLQVMGLLDAMATCSGMELTGNPLPMNHQNAFPLHHHPHTQNGGGPRTDVNPVTQIERLAMWDNGSEKVVQQNHPNIHQIFGDVDTDGVPDAGFRDMFHWMDVIEVHPLEVIFQDIAANPPATKDMRIPIFQWMQLLNQGYRIPGVVNTDAHYNHHGSGWLRNWFASSSDNPAEIDLHEMIHTAEDGHIIMSTGPFLSVRATSEGQVRSAIPGDDLKAGPSKKVKLDVKVQCPNWLDVNRVQVFVNGRALPELNRTRREHAEMFGAANEAVKFQGEFEIELETDAHLIVATIGEGLNMQKVMGEQYGAAPPVAVANPIFVDVDGNGFQHNGDELGVPLPK